MVGVDHEGNGGEERKDGLLGRSFKHTPRALVLAMLVVTVVVLAVGDYPHRQLANGKSTTVAKIVGAPAFVIAVRLVVLYAVVFVLASVLARIWNGQWLRKAGPFEVADEVQTLTDERDRLKGEAQEAKARIQTLTDQLREANTVFDQIEQAMTGREGEDRPWLGVKLPSFRRSAEE